MQKEQKKEVELPVIELLNKKSPNKLIFIILGFLALIILVVAGFLIYDYFSNKQDLPVVPVDDEDNALINDSDNQADDDLAINDSDDESQQRPSGSSSSSSSGGGRRPPPPVNPICTPNCAGKQCGDDGCNSNCGYCNSYEYCNNGICDMLDLIATIYADNSLSQDCIGNYDPIKRTCDSGNATAYNTIQKAVNVLIPGDVLYVRGGTYRESVHINCNGKENNRTFVMAHPGETVILEGTVPITGWTKCTSQAECLGNTNWNNIYYSLTPVNLSTKRVFEAGDFSLVAQTPDQSDPALEQVSEFFSLENEGNNFGHAIISVNTGNNGIGYFSISDSDGFYATLFKQDGPLIVKEVSSGDKQAHYTLSQDAINSNGLTKIYVNEEVFSNLVYSEVENQRFVVDSDFLNQTDGYWDNAPIRFWTHDANNAVADLKVKTNIQSRNMIVFVTPLKWSISPGGSSPDAYALLNHPLALDKPGEYYYNKTEDNKFKIYMWPDKTQNLVNDIGTSNFSVGFYIDYGKGNYTTIDGFVIRGYSHPGSTRSGGIINPGTFYHTGLHISNNVIYNIDGYGAICISSGSYDIIENNRLYDIFGWGILMGGNNGKAIANNVTKTESTNLKITLKKGIIMNNRLGVGGTHANGNSIYEGNENILVMNNKVIDGVFTRQLCENVTYINNIVDGLDKGGYLVADWGGTGKNIYMFNNLFIGSTNDASVTSSRNMVFINNILEGGGPNNDGVGDACDPLPKDPYNDYDNDNIQYPQDNCPSANNPNQNICACTSTYPCNQTDSDSDGYYDPVDTCPDLYNPQKTCYKGAHHGQNCENIQYCCDGLDYCKNGSSTVYCRQADLDNDEIGDLCDKCSNDKYSDTHYGANDFDGDGLCMDVDNCPRSYNPKQGANDCKKDCTTCDNDTDGVLNYYDNCVDTYNPKLEDTDIHIKLNNILTARAWTQYSEGGFFLSQGEFFEFDRYKIIKDYNNSDYSLFQESVAVDKGKDITNYIPEYLRDPFFTSVVDFSKDIDGNIRDRGAGWDIGPYEYQEQISGQKVADESINYESDSLSEKSFLSGMINFFKGILTGNTIKEITGNAIKTPSNNIYIDKKIINQTRL